MSAFTRSTASNRPSKLGVQFHFICRPTALTSIQSSNYFPNSKPCCGRSLHIPSRTPLSPSTACARPSPLACAKSLGLSAQHSSLTQDMVNLIGKRSKLLIIADPAGPAPTAHTDDRDHATQETPE